MRRALLVCLGLCVFVQPARAETRIYVTGDLFAEITRLSQTTTPDILRATSDTSPRDGVSVGGGGRIGAFFSRAWSLEFGLDLGRAISEERTLGFPGPAGLTIPAFQYQSRTRNQFTASSVLLGYHPPPRGRIQAGFRGGVSFMHIERTFTTTTLGGLIFTPGGPGIPALPGILPVLPRISLTTNEYGTVSNGLTATLAAEAAIGLSDHFAVVPEMRAHAGGIGGFLLRPGVAVRWRW